MGARALLDEMPARGVQPDVYSYSAAISACEKGGQWERAPEFLDEMQTRGVQPSVIAERGDLCVRQGRAMERAALCWRRCRPAALSRT